MTVDVKSNNKLGCENVVNETDQRNKYECDVLVIGGGPGGYTAAIRASQLGAKVILVEKEKLGGTCLNKGCIPTKILLHASEAMNLPKRFSDYGVYLSVDHINMEHLMKKKDHIVSQLRKGIEYLMKKNKIIILKGTAILEGPGFVKVTINDEISEIAAKKIIIATGSRVNKLKIPGADGGTIDSDTLLTMNTIPKSLLVIGGGAVGVEFSQIMSNLGTEVTLVEIKSQLLPGMDSDLSKVIEKTFKEEGIKVYENSVVKNLEKNEKSVIVTIQNNNVDTALEVDCVLDASGRIANLEVINYNLNHIEIENNKIVVNERMETSMEGIYAIGDVVKGFQLAHVASHEGLVAAENCMGLNETMKYDAVPLCVYTTPELASVGLSEEEALSKNLNIKKGMFPLMACGKANAVGAPAGFVKIITDSQTDLVLGVHIAGERATDIIAEGVLAIHMKAKTSDLIESIHAHPTITESVNEAARSVFNMSINI